MIPSENEIEREIKKSKLKITDMPSYIHSLIEEELEDHGDDQFRQGKEEGAAEERSRIESDRDYMEVINGCTKDQLEYAIDTLKEAVRDNRTITSVLSELESELCRQTPPIGLSNYRS